MASPTTSDILAPLNPRQRDAVEHAEGPLLIIAGPGSGKTRVIAHRIAYLVRVCGVRPFRITAVTFTNRAAREMKGRVERLLGTPQDGLFLGTFHAFCASLLRRDGKALGLDPSFVIYDEEDQLSLIKKAMEDVQVDPKRFGPRALQGAISSAKNRLWGPRELAIHRQSYFDE